MTIVRLDVIATAKTHHISAENLLDLQKGIKEKEGICKDLYRLETYNGRYVNDNLFSSAPDEVRLKMYYTLDGGCCCSEDCLTNCSEVLAHENMCGCAPLGFGCSKDCKTFHFCFCCTLCACRDKCYCCRCADTEHYDK
mmetsp:Transcript_20870/g.32554  ORF Transcript_20870/g.32554 Transcript_20870/m.32554 type:complete len:139 (-) Transcript_20870:30-446(-)